MVNPLLTIMFDIFLVGSALVILGGMVAEYRAAKQPSVGGQHVVPFRARAVRRHRRYAGSVGTGTVRRRLAA